MPGKGAPSLFSMATRACMLNVTSLKDVGDMSWDLVGPVLKKIDNPQQLRTIEIASPHIAGPDAELWKAFIARDIPNWQEKMIEPKNPASWWKVYRKLMRDEAKAKAEQEEQLRIRMEEMRKEVEIKKSMFVRDVLTDTRPRRQSEFVDGRRNPNGGHIGVDWATSPEQKERKPALKNAKTGRQIMGAIRRQSAQATRVKGLARRQPANAMLPTPKSQVARAPRSKMINHTQNVLSAVYSTPRLSTPTTASPNPNRRAPAYDTAFWSMSRPEKKIEFPILSRDPSIKPTKTEPAPTAASTAGRSAPPLTNAVRSTEIPRASSTAGGFSAALKAIDCARPQTMQSSAPPLVRKRSSPEVSIFMPAAKKRKR